MKELNLFASNRIKPENVKFPRGLDKLSWTVVTDYAAFCSAMESAKKTSTVVLDAAPGGFGLLCSYAMTEITCDKHHELPTLMVVGPDKAIKASIEEHIAKSKRWIDINKGKK